MRRKSYSVKKHKKNVVGSDEQGNGLWAKIKMGLYKRLKGKDLSPLELMMKRRREPEKIKDPLSVIRHYENDDNI